MSNIQYAGFWRRGIAVIIDMLVFIIAKAAILLVFLFIEKQNPLYFLEYVAVIVTYGLLIFVYARFLSSRWQATLGKRIMKAYVVDKNYKPISLKRAITRVSLPFLIILPLSLIQVSGYENQSSYISNNVGTKYIPQFIEIMPKTTSEILALKVDPKNLTYYELMAKITANPSLHKLYSEEFASLNNEKQSAMIAAGYDSNAFVLRVGENFAIIFISVICYLLLIVWYIPAALTRKKLALHDMIAGTRVLYGRV